MLYFRSGRLFHSPERICSRLRVATSSRRSRPPLAIFSPSGVMMIIQLVFSTISASPRFTSSLHAGVPGTGFFSASSSSPTAVFSLTKTIPSLIVTQFFFLSQPIAILESGFLVSSLIGMEPSMPARIWRSGSPSFAYFSPSSVSFACSVTVFSRVTRPLSAQRWAHWITDSSAASIFSARFSAALGPDPIRAARTLFSFIVRSIHYHSAM